METEIATTTTTTATTITTGCITDTVYPLMLLFGPLITGIGQHTFLDKASRGWHTTLYKSPYRPPGIVFGLVWTWAYLAIGYSAYILREKAPLWLICLYISHWLLLQAWGVIVLGAHRLDIGLIVMMMMVTIVCIMFPTVANMEPFLCLLLGPYPLWLGFLTYLNWFMWKWNRFPSVKKD